MNIRNIAVIAHVDHGKTTLVDALLKQTNVFRQNQREMQEERILDKNELERERGITILAKNCAINYKGVKINIIDTPGHADFSGEVERTLGMADGALLIVDAQEGPMPQTRFVLKKAIELDLQVIVVINKIDKKFARVEKIEEELTDLFIELATKESDLDFRVLYGVGRSGSIFNNLPEDKDTQSTVTPLLDAIISDIPAPKGRGDKPFKMVVSSLESDSHMGKLIIGKIHQGDIASKDKAFLLTDKHTQHTVEHVMVWEGLSRVKVDQAVCGDIVALAGFESASIGHTISHSSDATTLPSPSVSEPTLHMQIGPNTSPFAAKEGTFTTSRQIGERLMKELDNNVSLKVENLDNGQYKVSGRGELHLSILLETMRREGYELEVGKPEVIIKIIDGVKMEPYEEVDILVPQEYIGVINQEMNKRLVELKKMDTLNDQEVEFVYELPTRAIIGLRSLLLTQTKGTAVISSQFTDYKALGNTLPKMRKGALIAAVTGKSSEYGLRNLKGRGSSFIQPGIQVYEGMIVGQNAKDEDISINICKEKHLTNHRSKSHQGITQLAPDAIMSLEESIDFLEGDELLEITPLSLRIRKKHLTELERRRSNPARQAGSTT